jgi:hypothetical protein
VEAGEGKGWAGRRGGWRGGGPPCSPGKRSRERKGESREREGERWEVDRADEDVQAEVEILPAVPAAADEEAVEAGGVRKERADERRKRQKEDKPSLRLSLDTEIE